MKISITCDDKYEAQKFASLIYLEDNNDTFITNILNVVENEVVVSLKDKSAHSILFKSIHDVELFADFIQSVLEKKHKIVEATISNEEIEIVKE